MRTNSFVWGLAGALMCLGGVFGADNVAPEGFVALFNGVDLVDWKENRQDPAHWTVKDLSLIHI